MERAKGDVVHVQVPSMSRRTAFHVREGRVPGEGCHRMTEVTPPLDRSASSGGREFRVASGLEETRMYEVAELTEEEGLVVRIGSLLRWQAYAIVSILHPPFEE
jgi:hypothetical protein